MEPLVLVFYFHSAVLVVYPSHVFKGPTCQRQNIKNSERKKRESFKLVMAIPRNLVEVTVSKGLALSQPVPDSLSPVDIHVDVV